MSKYVLLYLGGSAPSTPADQEASGQAWGAWFGRVGDALVDAGNQFGDVTVHGAETTPSGTSGYTILTADSPADVERLLEGHPHLAAGGTIEAHDTIPM